MKNATIEKKGIKQGIKEHRKFEDIVIPYQYYIRWVIADSDGCLGPAAGSEHPADMASLGFMRYTLDRNPEIRISFCTGRPVAYVTAIAQCIGAFNVLEPEYREAFFNKTGFMLKGYPSVCENGAVIYDVAAKRAYPSPLMTQEQIESLNKIRAEVIPGLCHKTGMRQEAAAKLYCISLNPKVVENIEEECEIVKEELKD